MFRTVGIGLLSLLTVAVVAVALGGWQVQRNLASRTEELSGQLASLTSTQQAMLAQQRPPEITGLCYLGDRSKPAADVEIKVYRFPESGSTAGARGVIVGMERTDMDGHFKTGPLQYGDYCLLVALRAPPGEADELLLFKEIQTKPVSLAPGCGVVQSDVDVLASGRVELSAAAQVANIGKRDDGNDLKDRIVLNLLSGAEDKPVRAFDSDYLDGRTPISKWPVPMHFRQAPFAVSSLPRTWWLPPRTYAGGAYLQLNKNATAERGRFGYPQGEFVGSIGTAAHVEVPVTANETTTLRLTLPEGFAEDEFKTALPQPALPSGFFATGTVGALASKIKLKLQVEPAEKSAP